MRLLHAKSEILHEFFDDVPKYAILSHTWQEEELRSKAGYSKVHGCCQRAIKDGIEWVWVDTCCIDASSSSELQEAINSMYKWYTHAEVCYAYLLDVPPGQDAHAEASDFRKSRWHTRGWTLQELLAPKIVQFYDCEWNHIGEKSDLTQVLERCTGISGRYLSQSGRVYVRLASVAEKMSWAARRSTTRKEDIAYCLLGLFGVNMPMLYGEGTRAFGRLQEEIIRRSRDQSLWSSRRTTPTGCRRH
ncbi:HET-domain-containing protein [Xylariomycetidae sp. FL2044]|nr:HET-domain-containing protein [Xylariomycetidae sp. FL2044]